MEKTARSLAAVQRMLRSVLLVAGVVVASAVAEGRAPNIVLFLVDDMGWMDSTPYGSQYYETPNIARLATQGMRFTRAYSQPLCSPTRACLLTGKNAARHGITVPGGHLPPVDTSPPAAAPANQPVIYPRSRRFLDPAEYTLAEAVRDAGYRTGHFGKWHLGLLEPHWPEKQGFDVAFHCHPDPGPPGNYFSPYGVTPPGAKPAAGHARVFGTITDGPPGEYITDRLTDEAIRFVEANKDRPFFLNLWHYGVHGPWGHKEALTADMARRSDPTGRQKNPVMASMLKSVDESLGRLLDTLERLGIADDTLVIFTSDNGGNTHSNTKEHAQAKGPAATSTAAAASYRKWAGHEPPTNNAPLRDGKGTLYEGGVRVPLIVRFPGHVTPGSTSDALVGCTDVYPTVLELLGIARSPTQVMDGVSYAGVLRGTATSARDSYVIWFPGRPHGVAAYQGDWKLIRREEPAPEEPGVTRQLYNLADDIGETRNLAAAMPEKVRELEAIIDRLLLDTAAVVPRPNPAYRADANAAATVTGKDFTGLVAQKCRATAIDGGYRIEGSAPKPFLGTTRVKLSGPLRLSLRVRSATGGQGRIQWRTADEAEFPADRPGVPFPVAAGGDWQDVAVELPVQGTTAIVRVYLPMDRGPVDVQSIRYTDRDGRAMAWDFKGVEP